MVSSVDQRVLWGLWALWGAMVTNHCGSIASDGTVIDLLVECKFHGHVFPIFMGIFMGWGTSWELVYTLWQ